MMEEVKAKNDMKKTQVFNVVILDRSGSMSSIRSAAVDGFNETLAGIKNAQEKFAETQEHFVSLVTFCSCKTNYVFDKTPVMETSPLTVNDYIPCCCTPLYDAMGITLNGMRAYVKSLEEAVVVVTIITDGMENASREYTGVQIKELVESLKKEGWTFTYMGANQNSVEVAMQMSIRNSRDFSENEEGTLCCMAKDRKTRMNFFTRLDTVKRISEGAPIMREAMSRMADEAFDEEEGI